MSFKDNDPCNMIVYRENFHEAILKHIDLYRKELLVSKKIQRNFIRKMDDICGIRRAYYFAYGSNMDRMQLIERIGKYHAAHSATLHGYKFIYNKKSVDGSAKANIEEDAGNVVYGICYEIDKDDFGVLRNYEKGYDKKDVDIKLFDADDNKIYTAKALAYISISTDSSVSPAESYKNVVINAARYWELDDSYIRDYLNS